MAECGIGVHYITRLVQETKRRKCMTISKRGKLMQAASLLALSKVPADIIIFFFFILCLVASALGVHGPPKPGSKYEYQGISNQNKLAKTRGKP